MAGNPIHFGIIGCAEISRKVSRAMSLAPNAILSAIGSRSIDKAKRFVVENGLPEAVNVYGTYEEVLDDPSVEAVYVPLPTSMHVRWAVAIAERKKHVFLEKPTALNVADLDRILEACESNGVQFMDCTMWVHHPRTHKMRELLSDPTRFGELRSVHSIFGSCGDAHFLENDVRVKPDLDGLGGLGDTGWYCVRSILWANNYELPKTVTALQGTYYNKAGVILSCGASMVWEDGRVATFQCGFRINIVMDVTVHGSNGTLHLHDFVIPFEETSAPFTFVTNTEFKDKQLGWKPFPSEHVVATDLPQEVLMVEEFVRLVKSIKDSGSKPDNKWPTISRKTQLVIDAVKSSIDNGCEPINVVHSDFAYCGDGHFLENDVRVKPDLDGLGALGDTGWYCIRSILWANDYELPKTVTALQGTYYNKAGVILSCGASMVWEDGKVATFHCGLRINLVMDVTVHGSNGTLHLHDFVIPFEETSAPFTFGTKNGWAELSLGWKPLPSEHVVVTDLPQEAHMVEEFVRLVKSIKDTGSKPDSKWPTISRKTQLVIDAVKASIDKGCEPINVVS